MNKIIIICTLFSTTVFSQLALSDDLKLDTVDGFAGAGEQYCSGLLLLNQVPSQINALFSDVDCDACGSVNPVQIVADNFSIQTDSFVSELVIYVGYFPANMPLKTDEWTVSFHTNTSNQPGFVIYSENNVASSRTASGAALFGVDEYRVVLSLETSVELDAGTYWVEIHNNSIESTESVFWVVGASHSNSIVGSAYASAYPAVSWNADNTNNFALQLCDLVSDIIYFDGFETVIAN